MIYRFRQLGAKHTRVIILQAMLFPSSGRPTSVMEHKKNEEFALGRSSCFVEQFCTFNRMLPMKKAKYAEEVEKILSPSISSKSCPVDSPIIGCDVSNPKLVGSLGVSAS